MGKLSSIHMSHKRINRVCYTSHSAAIVFFSQLKNSTNIFGKPDFIFQNHRGSTQSYFQFSNTHMFDFSFMVMYS